MKTLRQAGEHYLEYYITCIFPMKFIIEGLLAFTDLNFKEF